jgi:hypothetical protein
MIDLPVISISMTHSVGTPASCRQYAVRGVEQSLAKYNVE